MALAAAVFTAAILGWREFFFLCDDAFIAFRYVSNAMSGYGLVWNPPPFAPVEGYTSWLWVTLLRITWELTGVEPPVASNYLSLAFGIGTLALGFRFLLRMRLSESLDRLRPALLGLAMLGTLTNRTFLAWLSSGLETALFNFCFTWWVFQALAPMARRGPFWAALLSTSALLTALTRPDGMLLVPATILLLLADFRERPIRLRWPARRSLGAVPLIGVAAHMIWRRFTYGDWLPNTYYAKYSGAWPESGARYALSFVLEYGLWVWLVLAAIWLVRKHAVPLRVAIAVGALGVHVAFYTIMIGGDHFEYRVYSHLILLLFISFVWFVSSLDLKPVLAVSLMTLFVAGSWPIPWVHHFDTRNLVTREETYEMFRPVAGKFPPGLRAYAEIFDRQQAWLIRHYVCNRHQEHKILAEFLNNIMKREVEPRFRWEGRAVLAQGSVGVVGWVLPNVAIIDTFGLNDYVVARHPRAETEERVMAHDREPPPDYVECFRPNVVFRVGAQSAAFVSEPREIPLTDEAIRRCEARFRASGRPKTKN